MAKAFDYRSVFDKNGSHPNTLLLKKLIALSYYGNFEINGQRPNAACKLEDYLMSKGNFIIDLNALDPVSRHQFESWLLDAHRKDAKKTCWQNVIARDYRGFTTETPLSLWGRLRNFLYHRRSANIWSVDQTGLSFRSQLRSISMSRSDHGLLCGFNILNLAELLRFSSEPDEERVNDQNNSKRIIVTPKLVKMLLQLDVENTEPEILLQSSHPLSITVPPHKIAERHRLMDEYRHTELYARKKSWYKRLWQWIKSGIGSVFKRRESNANQAAEDNLPPPNYTMELLNQSKGEKSDLKILYDPDQDKVLVFEKCPNVDSAIFGGGGPNIFGHVGAARALDETGITCKNFAGSSAGAIMAMLNYLGYTPTEIRQFFGYFSAEVLVHYAISWNGLSHSRALKAAFDYAVNKKVLEIIEHFGIDQTEEGRKILENAFGADKKITFRFLSELKKRVPECGLGDVLSVTGTNQSQNKLVIFSAMTTADMEVSEAVRISSSMPGVFKPSLWNGEKHIDGGVSRNVPIDMFPDVGNTFLSSRYGNNLGTICFCFDTGVELDTLNDARKRLHRIPWYQNWIYSLITGIRDPASGWQMDLSKVLQHSHQVVVIPVGVVNSTNFTVKPSQQESMMRNGFQSAMRHLKITYDIDSKTSGQYMHANYNSLEELMVQLAARERYDLFLKLKPFALTYGVSLDRLEQLENSYLFYNYSVEAASDRKNKSPFQALHVPLNQSLSRNELSETLRGMRIYDRLYPIFLEIKKEMFVSDKAYANFKAARHYLKPHSYAESLEYLSKNAGERHFILYLLERMMERHEAMDADKLCRNLEAIGNCLFDYHAMHGIACWFYLWNLSESELDTALDYMQQKALGLLGQWMQRYQDERIMDRSFGVDMQVLGEKNGALAM